MKIDDREGIGAPSEKRPTPDQVAIDRQRRHAEVASVDHQNGKALASPVSITEGDGLSSRKGREGRYGQRGWVLVERWEVSTRTMYRVGEKVRGAKKGKKGSERLANDAGMW